MRPIFALVFMALPFTAAADGNPADGEMWFSTFCAACHGAEARGDGPMAKVLEISPPDLTALARENDGVFPVFRVVRQIDGRDPLLAHGGEMPLFGHLFDFPEGAIASEAGQPIVTAQPIADITAWLASVQR